MSGTMDEFGERNALLTILPSIYEKEKKNNSGANTGQIDIFSLAGNNLEVSTQANKTPIPDVEKAPRYQILQWEKELLGIYFSSHPLDNLQTFFESKGVKQISEALEGVNNEIFPLGVMVNKIRKITTRKNEVMAFLGVEDKSGMAEIVVFPKKYQELKDKLEENKPMLVAIRISVKDGKKSLILEKGQYIDESKYSDDFEGVTFRIRQEHTEEEIRELKEYISSSNGDTPVRIIVNGGDKNKSVLLEKRIEMNSETKKWLRKF